MVAPLHIFESSAVRYLVYQAVEPSLLSSVSGQLLVPRAITTTRQSRSFSIVGPSTWNGLPLEVCLLPKNNENEFCKMLKTNLFHRGWAVAPLSRFLEGAP